jgi:energy-coupling factor transporter ATP-binding protein EcfA2
MATTPLEKLQVAYRALDLFPLVSAESIERYRVEYGREVLVRLEKEVEASDERSKFVFAGHRGCGKSTLLKRFAVNMKKKNNFGNCSTRGS